MIYDSEDLKLEFQNVQNITMTEGKIPINIDGRNATCNEIVIEDKIKLRDYLKQRKLGINEIDYIAEEAVDSMIPNASVYEREKAKESYLERVKIRKLKTFVFKIYPSSEKRGTTVIIASASIKDRALNYLKVKQNMIVNLLTKLGCPTNDFLLWLYWRSVSDPHLSKILIRNITRDETDDRSYSARSQTERGGDNVMDSPDLKYRIGKGFPLKSMTFKLKEEEIGASLEIGIYQEDTNDPVFTIFGFYPTKFLNDRIQLTGDSERQREIYSKALAIDVIYKLIHEYKQDNERWQDEKPKFISKLADESFQVK